MTARLIRTAALAGACALIALFGGGLTSAQTDPGAKISLYGFAMLDMGYDFGQNDPDWFDTMRPTKLPAFADEFGHDGRFYSGVRQSRLGVKGWIPTEHGEVYGIFEFELFGTGVDAGQTTFRLRHAYGQWQSFGAGQTWSPFMDIDVFPNSIEYWGPNGMVFFRNVQVRYMPMMGDDEVVIAMERPGASGDGGVVSELVTTQGVQGRFPAPDFSAHYRMNRGWGHVQFASMIRYIRWDDNVPDPVELSGHTFGWGLHVSANYKINKDTLRGSVVYGAGIQNYMNDATVDIGVQDNPGNPAQPVVGKAVPMIGFVAFYDRTWNDRMTSTFGYSMLDNDNTDLQAPDSFKTGQYALVNFLYYPVKNVMFGPELQWGRRENFTDGFAVDDVRLQFSAKVNFGHTWGGL